MKRFTAAALAAATAMSLAVAPAQADGLNDLAIGHESSSQVTEAELTGYALAAIAAEVAKPGAGFSKPYMGSSESGLFKTDDEASEAQLNKALNSSARNDANKGYPLGTTYDILVGTGIAAAVLAVLGGAAYAGVIPGVQLPALPF
ncbi:hypothetical protein [Corynebacterium afermentans]|uniref:hypothetical protein n=1 Tax=Corynebacterium afermentans TaxID=38286 RepID=UPI0025738005|nr:hypothetical protein [Corynebacterium afermentans]MDC7109003.1 hypothetical protein [Corynebacterium afermentans]